MAEQKKQNLADPKVRKRFVTYKEATELYSMGLTRVQEHARIAGATYKMGNKVLVKDNMTSNNRLKLGRTSKQRSKR